ncbi:hypothetical protein CLV51_1011215 [Chitinophaga niastensis]|uniref:Uncharacterized protein n=1 Tax=Chitinophaga niastensis TaxID=536980 RepID=A0A2P8HUI6_CHINA|nr:hypothetical protein CLV51_1011215 [Chitinophaga niastensis]
MIANAVKHYSGAILALRHDQRGSGPLHASALLLIPVNAADTGSSYISMTTQDLPDNNSHLMTGNKTVKKQK